MKNITTKKLLICSVVALVLGIGIVALARYRIANLSSIDHENEIHFYRTYVWLPGVALFLLGLLSVIFAVGRVIARDIKRLIVVSVGLLLISDGIMWLCQRKLSDFSAYHDGSWFDYKYTYLPIAIFLFALGVAGFLAFARRLFLDRNTT